MDLAALLSINLAVMNILPLPMLDGGRMAFVLIEIAAARQAHRAREGSAGPPRGHGGDADPRRRAQLL